MVTQKKLFAQIDDFFDGEYEVTPGRKVPVAEDIGFGREGREIELAMLFIDIRQSTKLVASFRRVTAAKMAKSFQWGVAQIARRNQGEIRGFNGDGVLVVFAGQNKCVNAAQTALQLSWFLSSVMKPKVEAYLQRHIPGKNLTFDGGIGIDVGKVLVVRGGIRGPHNNDLVWIGNTTNNAAKLADFSEKEYRVAISERMYHRLAEHRYSVAWEPYTWVERDNRTLYRTKECCPLDL